MQSMSRLRSSLLSAVLAGVLVLAAYADVLLVAAVVVVVQVLIASAPSLADARGRSVPTPRFVPALLGGLVATALATFPRSLPGADGTRDVLGVSDTGVLAGILPAIAVAVFASLLTQMRRTDGRRELTTSTSYAVSLGVAAAVTSGWIGAAHSLGGPAVVAIVAAGLAAGLAVWAAPFDRVLTGSAAVVVGAGAGAVVAASVDSVVTPVFGVAVGSAAALFAVMGQVFGRAWVSARSHASVGWGFPAAMSVALVAPIAYVGGQLVAASIL
jgi:hypothetical protein